MIKISEKSQDLLIKISVVIIIYLIFAKPVFNFLGITKSNADRIRNRELENANSPFKTTYWQKYYQYPGKTTGKKLTQQRFNEMAKNIIILYNAFGYFTDNEDEITGVFYNLKSKSEVSIFSYMFENSYKKDLLTYLGKGKDLMPQNGLGDDDISIIIKYVNSLPAA